MSKKSAEIVSVRITPNATGSPAGKLADAEVVFEAEAGPFTGMKLMGFACGTDAVVEAATSRSRLGSTPSTENAGATRCSDPPAGKSAHRKRFGT